MKTSKFSESQIVSILKQADAGVPVKDVCRQAGISTPTFYQWKSKYGGMDASDLKRVKELEAENAKLKRMYAELALDMLHTRPGRYRVLPLPRRHLHASEVLDVRGMPDVPDA